MLRLPPTRIDLGPRDLVWHIDRYQQRKAQYDQGTSVRSSTKASRKIHQTHSFKAILPYRSRPPIRAQIPSSSTADNALISTEPVPRNSRAFWDDVLAVAGTSLHSTEPLPHERYTEEELTRSTTSLHSQETLDVSVSIEESSILGPVHQSGEDIPGIQDVMEAATHPTQPESQYLLGSLHSPEHEKGSSGSGQSVIHPQANSSNASRKRPSFFRFLSSAHDGSTDDDPPDMQRSFSSELDLDGSSDSEQEDEEQEQHPQIATAISISQAAPRPILRHARPLIREHSLSLSDEEAELAETIAGLHELIDGAASPRAMLPGPVEQLRARSGTLPRSPLYITHAAASSSPEKHGRPPASSAHAAASLLSVLPRRPKRYKPRSEASNESLGSENAAAPISRSAIPSTGSPSPSPRHTNHSTPSLHSSPPIPPSHSSRRNPTPTSSSRYHPSPPPLPPPFSTSRRLLSFNLALPSSSPIPASQPPSSPPPYNLTHSPHRSMRVYNDALPPSSQPTTPHGLPRNGLVHTPYSTTYPLPAPYTAPAAFRAGGAQRTGRGQPTRRAWEGTPTRNSWRQRSGREEQENGGLEREGEMRRWREREIEEEREEGWLDWTPEREGRGVRGD
ncbi:hypothetical protein MMC13_002343 [Lambiella insularis]|nr:hypothetical protein [Lambiella insularis]